MESDYFLVESCVFRVFVLLLRAIEIEYRRYYIHYMKWRGPHKSEGTSKYIEIRFDKNWTFKTIFSKTFGIITLFKNIRLCLWIVLRLIFSRELFPKIFTKNVRIFLPCVFKIEEKNFSLKWLRVCRRNLLFWCASKMYTPKLMLLIFNFILIVSTNKFSYDFLLPKSYYKTIRLLSFCKSRILYLP